LIWHRIEAYRRLPLKHRYITTDISRFCETLASLYSNVSKPTLDLLLFGVQLGRSIGRWGSLGLFVNYFFTAWVLKKVTPAFGKLAAVEAKLEGDFRGAHSRLITNAEEIAYVITFLEEGDISL
jgi:ATP-binding cassette subfamily D (ALD) long-chain fatty acid import protein